MEKKAKLKKRKKWNQNKLHYFEKLQHKDFRIDIFSRCLPLCYRWSKYCMFIAMITLTLGYC